MSGVGRRFGHILFLALGAAFLCFALVDLAPGDHWSDLNLTGRYSEQSVQAWRSASGLHYPLPQRFLNWLSLVAAGSWGVSLQYGCSVSELLLDRAKNTLLLTLGALVIAWPLGIVYGVWLAASGRRGLLARAGDLVAPVVLALPDLVVALACLAIAAETGMLPAGGMRSVHFAELSVAGQWRDLVRHLALPVACLALSAFPGIMLHVRAAVGDVLTASFLQAARAHGVRQVRLLFRHALLGASNPLLSLFGLSIGGLLSTSLVVEAVMGWPGLGRLMVEAIQARDVYVVVGATVASAMMAAFGTFAADLLLLWTDPRLRPARA